jgi:uncharacterized protein
MKPPSGVPRAKLKRLHALLKRHGRVLVGFSGGKDSFFLLREAERALGPGNVVAVHAGTPFSGEGARGRVAYFRKRSPLPVRTLRLDLLRGRLRRNPRDRCYWCKRLMFRALQREARRLGIVAVLDGTTLSDQAEHRPGRRALAELGILSPLRDAGIASAEIAAELAREGFEPFFLTSSTCLATRFPYGEPLRPSRIAAVGRVEHFLAGKGIYPLRVRHIPEGVRIEVGAERSNDLLALRDDLLAFCQGLGLQFVTLDLAGLRKGAWDKPKRTNKKKN